MGVKELGKKIGKDMNEQDRIKTQFGSSDAAYYIKLFTDEFSIKDRGVRIQEIVLDTTNTFVLSHPSAGILGTSKLGRTVSSTTYSRVIHPNRTYVDNLYDTFFKDTTNTNAAWGTTGTINFTGGNLTATSLVVYKNNESINSAKLTSLDSGSINYQMSNNGGSSWENVTSGELHTFSSSEITLESFSGEDGAITDNTTTGREGQTFTIGNTGINKDVDLSSVKFKLYRRGSPGIINCELYAVDGNNKPAGSILSSGTIDGDSLTTSSSGQLVEFTMDSVTLNSSTQYALVIYGTNIDGDNKVFLKGEISGSPSYTGGSRISSNDSGSSWSVDTDSDFVFQVLGFFSSELKWRAAATSSANISSIEISY